MLKPELNAVGNTTAISRDELLKLDLNINYSQKSLAYFPTYGTYCTYYLENYNLRNHKIWQSLAREIDLFCEKTNFKTTVILGVGFELWSTWSKELGYSLPKVWGLRRN